VRSAQICIVDAPISIVDAPSCTADRVSCHGNSVSIARRSSKFGIVGIALAVIARAPGPGTDEPDLDLLIMAWQRGAGRSSAAELVDAEHLRAAMFNATGDTYKHYNFPETPKVDLTDETLWSRYLAFQSARQREEFTSAARGEDRARSVLQLDAAQLEAAIGERVRRIVAIVHRRAPALPGDPATV